MSEESESRIRRVSAFLELRMSRMGSYHAHKETMAHAAVLVVLGYVGAIISIQRWPPEWVPAVCVSRDAVALAGAMTVWLLIHVYLRWQLRKRRVAARYVNSLLKVLRRWAHTPPSQEDLKPYERTACKQSRWRTCVDFLIPWPSAQVPSDEGLDGYPTAMVNEYKNTKTGAVFAECLVSYGSILLGLILLVRVWVADGLSPPAATQPVEGDEMLANSFLADQFPDVMTVLGFLGALTLQVLIAGYWFGRRRDVERLTQVQTYFHKEYLSDRIKTARKALQEGRDIIMDVSGEQLNPRWLLSIALQRVGIMAYGGGISLQYALALNATQFVSDWVAICKWVREKCWHLGESTKDQTLDHLPFERRHAEWLALVAWRWLKHRDTHEKLNLTDKTKDHLETLEKFYGSPEAVARREKLLFEIDADDIRPKPPRGAVKKIRKYPITRVGG